MQKTSGFLVSQHIHPHIHLHRHFNSLLSWVRYDLSLRTTVTANDIYIRYLYQYLEMTSSFTGNLICLSRGISTRNAKQITQN